jgi:hypothetical protein
MLQTLKLKSKKSSFYVEKSLVGLTPALEVNENSKEKKTISERKRVTEA